MRKIGKESAEATSNGDGSGNGWLSGHRCALILGIIVIVAFLLRFVFAYGVSADGSYALSGGAGAQYHLHVIESILDGSWSMTDDSVNYPVGGSYYIPPLLDFLAAGVASILGGSTEDASLALAVLAPIFGALACIPVYLIGKELYDKTIGVAAALIYAFLALPICTSVFSNGNEYALAAFLVAFSAYFAVKMVKAADAEDSTKGAIVKNGVAAGIFLALAALTWNGFRYILILFAIMMVVQIVVSRIRGKDFSGILAGYALILLIGGIVPAAYYVPADLMDTVYSGCLLTAVVSVVFAYIFLALAKKPWVVVIPALVIVFVAFAAILSVAAPDYYHAMFFGNDLYESSIMDDLTSDRVSMSNVAAYYGWLTMWLPICLGIYEIYCLIRKDRSSTRLFTMLWMFGMSFMAWTSYANAAVVGSVFAVGSAAVLVQIIRKADLRSYASSIKAAGFPGCFRKLIKPFPFITVLVVAFLVVVPNVSFAVDAGIPSNDADTGAYYYGNTTFTIKTGDSYPMGDVWDGYKDADKDGAIATWIDNSYDAVTQGGFSSVADTNGNGASAVAQIYLAQGSGAAVSAMILRIMTANGGTDFRTDFSDSTVYTAVAGYIADPSSAKAAIEADPDTYGDLRSDITDENAVYLVCINEMTSHMSDVEIMETYDRICSRTGDKIGYVLLDGSQLPLQYNDSDSFSTIAYFANYSVDRYGAATQYYSYNTYYGTTVYTDAIYETLLWKALIGPSATDAGYSSSYSQLSALALSDGSDNNAKAIPGYGLAGFEVAEWRVMYNADSDATLSSDGWSYMDGWEAMSKQKTDGGMINYLSSIVLLAYTGAASSSVQGGTVVDSANSPVQGASADVYVYSDVYDTYVLYSEATTASDGSFRVAVSGDDYRVEIKIGNVVLATLLPSDFASGTVTVGTASLSGEVAIDGKAFTQEQMEITLESDAATYTASINDGTIFFDSILPGTYSYTLLGNDGTSRATGTVSVYPGENAGFTVAPSTYTITATVKDVHGDNIDGTKYDSAPVVVATNESNGMQFTAEVGSDGRAVVYVIPGVYSISMGNGLVSFQTSTQNASSGNRTVSNLTAYDSETVTIASDNVFTVYGGSFSTVSYTDNGSAVIDVPVGMATDKMAYSVYAINGSSIVYTVVTESGAGSLQTAPYSVVTGTVTNGSAGASGTVTFVSETLEGFQIAVSADSDGKYTAYIPQGTYTVYTHNGSDKVAFESGFSVSSSTATKDVSLVDGRRVTANLRYDQSSSSSNLGLPFALGQIAFTYSSHEYTLTSMTNSSGSAVFYIPDSTAATVSFNGGTLDNEYFACTSLSNSVVSGTATTTSTVLIRYVGDSAGQDNTVKKVSFTAPYDMDLTFYEDVDDKESTLTAGQTVELRPGQYTVKIAGTTGHYFDGTAYLYPGQTEFTGLDVIEVGTVNTTTGTNDAVTVTSDGEYHKDGTAYYVQVGYEYYFTSTNGDNIAYGYADMKDGSATVSMDLTAASAKMEVTGVVGIDADGTILIINGSARHSFDVENGAYTLTLPSSWTSVEAQVDVKSGDDDAYTSTATVQFTGMKDGSIRNAPVASADSESDDDSDFDASVSNVSASNGVLTAQVSVTNNTDSLMTYQITAGSDLTLDAAYSVNVAAGQTQSVNVTGRYDAGRVALGSSGMTLSVADINASTTKTLDLLPSTTGGDSTITVMRAGETGASNDRVSASQYMYALTFKNDGADARSVTVSLAVPSGWNVSILNSDGTYATAIGGSVEVYGLQTTTYYLAFMLLSSEEGSTVSVPSSVNATVTFDGGSSQTLSLNATDVEIGTGSVSVSGGDSLMERSSVPGGIWFLVAVIILLVIAILWLASKRGVFSRN